MKEQTLSVIHLQMVKERDVVYGRRRMENPREAALLFKSFLGDIDRECLVVCALDTKQKPTCIQIAAMGALNYCPVSIPEIFKAALLSNAASVILCHNHPSGDCAPSDEDILLTERVIEAGRLLGVPLLDHVILGEGNKHCSLRESYSSLGWEGMKRRKTSMKCS